MKVEYKGWRLSPHCMEELGIVFVLSQLLILGSWFGGIIWLLYLIIVPIIIIYLNAVFFTVSIDKRPDWLWRYHIWFGYEIRIKRDSIIHYTTEQLKFLEKLSNKFGLFKYSTETVIVFSKKQDAVEFLLRCS